MTRLSMLENEEVIEKAIKSCKTQEDIFGENGLIQGLIRRALQSALNGELEDHLGGLVA